MAFGNPLSSACVLSCASFFSMFVFLFVLAFLSQVTIEVSTLMCFFTGSIKLIIAMN